MQEKRIAISGVNGFVGHHLARELKNKGAHLIGVGHDPGLSGDLKGIVDEYYSQDLADMWPAIADVDGVVHLAGLAAIGPSFDAPQHYINTNSAIVTNLCEYYLGQEKRPRIILVSSGAIYSPTQPMPINEGGEIAFGSPYAISKVLNEHQADYYRLRGLDCVVARPFNHIGPGQANGFILPDLYDRIENTQDNTILVGNIDTKRDYTDVRDIVGAYILMMAAPELRSGVYNICSGVSLSGREILSKLKTAMDRPDIDIEIDRSLVRPTDIPEITGDSSRLQKELGWRPSIHIDQTIKDFVGSKAG